MSVAKDEDGDGEPEYTSTTTPPAQPDTPSPINDAGGVLIEPTLTWTGGDPDIGDVVTYDVYFGFDPNVTLLAESLSACTYSPGTLSYGRQYYWKVIARDSDGVTTEGPLWRFSTALQVHLQTGWNMVSVPVQAADISTGTIFTGSAAVYTWDPESKSYVSPDTVDPKCSYWVAVTEPKTITVTGTPVTEWTDSLITGWNMIGSVYGASEAVADLITEADSDPLLRNAIYHWNPSNKSYEPVSAIQPGEGYWLTTTADCQLTLPPPP